MSLFKDFFSLFFPRICFSCDQSLYKNEQNICTTCIYHLPKTDYHLQDNNPVSKLFWGRITIQFAASQLFFTKGGKVQHLIHQLKYEGKKEIGDLLGKLYGQELLGLELLKDVDLIIPVPLHPKREKKRGYNQAEIFANGLAKTMKKPVILKAVERILVSDTQTKKSRFSRWKNVEQVFRVKCAESLKGKHILLVDDVVTTGATLEACANKILELPDTKLSIATIAFSER